MIRQKAVCIIGMLLLLPLVRTQIRAQTVMTREEAAVYALRAANALNTSIRWLTTSELPAGEEVADVENDKIDHYALQGLDYEDIVSIISSPWGYLRGWLKDVNYLYPASNGFIYVNAFSGEVFAQGEFPTGIMGPLSKEQAINIALEIVNSFYGRIDHEWKIGICPCSFCSCSYNLGEITVIFYSICANLKNFGRRKAFVSFSSEGYVSEVYFYPLGDNIVPYITVDEAKQFIIDALEEAYASGKETYFISMGQAIKLPKVRFVCFGKHPEAIDPDPDESIVLALVHSDVFLGGEGIYFYDEDDFLQPKYIYAILTTIDIIDKDYIIKTWTYYLVDIITGKVNGFGLDDIYFWVLGNGNISKDKKDKKDKINRFFEQCIILNNRKIRLINALFDKGRVYIAQDYLPVFKVQFQNNRLHGRNGEIYLIKDELRQIKGKIYIPLRRICEVSGIRLWWDNERKVPILRAEWLEPRKLLAQRR